MPAKSTSPEAAQKRVWKAELKTLESARRKVFRDFDREEVRLSKEVVAASKKLAAYQARRDKQQPRVLRNVDQRLAVLRGRLGL